MHSMCAPMCDTADVQAILPFPPNPLKLVLCDVSHVGRTSNAFKVTMKQQTFLFQMVATSCISVRYLWKYWTEKSEFRQNYRTVSRPQFHLSLLGSLASLRTYRYLAAKVWTSKGGGKQWQTTPQELAQDAVCQSHNDHMTGLWFLPTRPLRLNSNEWMNLWKYGFAKSSDNLYAPCTSLVIYLTKGHGYHTAFCSVGIWGPSRSLICDQEIYSGSYRVYVQGTNRLQVTSRKTEIVFKNELYGCLWMTVRPTDREQHVVVPKTLVETLIDWEIISVVRKKWTVEGRGVGGGW